jgi:hypothetical protein
MKRIGIISTAVLSLSLAGAIPAYAQQEQHDQQEERKDKPAEEKEKKTQQEKPSKQTEKRAEPEKNAKPEQKNAQQHAQEGKPEKQMQRAGGGRIPDDRYKANFGQEHHFRVSEGDYRNHRFQYGGYWFGFGGAWPSNWLYTQDVYVIEIDGVYYLCNPMYPGVNVVLNVTP